MSQLIKQLEMIGQSADKRYGAHFVDVENQIKHREFKAFLATPEDSNKAVFFVNQ